MSANTDVLIFFAYIKLFSKKIVLIFAKTRIFARIFKELNFRKNEEN